MHKENTSMTLERGRQTSCKTSICLVTTVSIKINPDIFQPSTIHLRKIINTEGKPGKVK